MSLRDKLELQSQESARRFGPNVVRLFENFIEALRTTGLTRSSLKQGDRIPDFMLPDARGRLVSSRELLERGPIILGFFRGDWCPYCNLELEALQDSLGAIEECGAILVAVTPDTGAAFAAPHKRHALSFTILSDADNGLALQFGVAYRVPDSIRQLYLQIGLDLSARHGNVAWFLPIPATYIVDRHGIIRHADLDVDFRRRMEPAAIVDLLRQLAAE